VLAVASRLAGLQVCTSDDQQRCTTCTCCCVARVVVRFAHALLLSSTGPDAAAASAKAQKKLQKLQGIASQAEQEHAGIIVDGEVLQEDCLNNSSPPSCDSNGKSNSSNKLSPTQIGLDRRKGLTAAADANTQGNQEIEHGYTCCVAGTGLPGCCAHTGACSK